jgi:hypothetical protein
LKERLEAIGRVVGAQITEQSVYHPGLVPPVRPLVL